MSTEDGLPKTTFTGLPKKPGYKNDVTFFVLFRSLLGISPFLSKNKRIALRRGFALFTLENNRHTMILKAVYQLSNQDREVILQCLKRFNPVFQAR